MPTQRAQCVQCGQSFSRPISRGRPKTLCSDECRKVRFGAYSRPKQDRRNCVCVDCGVRCQRSKPQGDWLPPAEARCRKCFHEHRRALSVGGLTCACGKRKQRTASNCRACYTESMKTHRLRESRRPADYDRAHNNLRRAWETILEVTEINCARCDQPILADQTWHLDHRDDRNGYLGPSHSRCNLAAGRRAHQAQLRAATASLKVVVA